MAFIGGAVTFIGEGAVTSVEGAVTSIGGAVTFVDKGGSAVGRSFKAAGIRVGDVKGVNKRNLRQWLITYELKGPSLLIYSLISLSNHSIGSSSWAISYSACGTNLLFLLKTYTPLY